MIVEGLVLAAGFSSRAGSFKMSMKLGKRTLLQRTIDSMLDFCTKIIVVGGNQYNCVVELVKDYSNVEVVLNKNYELGMFSSVQKGLQFINGDWFFFTPGDYPFISKKVYISLLETSKKNNYNIYVPVAGGRKGHPVLIKSSLVGDILEKPVDSSLRDFINHRGFGKVEVDDFGIHYDVDTEEDYKNALKKSNL